MNNKAEYLSGLVPNPAYGDGYFLRAWSMRRLAPDRLRVTMEDTFHALWIEIAHDAGQVLQVDAEWVRYPISSCAGAAAFLANMSGTSLEQNLAVSGKRTDVAAHCTHMLDSFRLGVAHIKHRRPDHCYNIVIPDTASEIQSAQLMVDGRETLSITIGEDMTILTPQPLAGAPLMRGLSRWAENSISEHMFEMLFMIQRAMFVSWGRKVDMVRYQGESAATAGPPEASCYASQPERYRDATRLSSDRPNLTRHNALRF